MTQGLLIIVNPVRSVMVKKLVIRKETKKKMRPITKSAFHGLLNRAATTLVRKPAPK